MNGIVVSEGVKAGKNRVFKDAGEKTRIVAVGGNGLASVEMFESETGTWTALPDMTTMRGYEPASCVVGGTKIIVAGGHDNSDYLDTAEVFDFATKK